VLREDLLDAAPQLARMLYTGSPSCAPAVAAPSNAKHLPSAPRLWAMIPRPRGVQPPRPDALHAVHIRSAHSECAATIEDMFAPASVTFLKLSENRDRAGV
jgi:hypothetical protein